MLASANKNLEKTEVQKLKKPHSADRVAFRM